ncbi:MAG TPA: hypothetical protein VLB82_10230 [Thermodesulfobacteriota bacterium]|nr:hypothetical protein [Thermodesulfobacteriota bacterium]
MNHPEILLLPIMMFADYFLTILGAIKIEQGYSKHFKTEHYELNPQWQQDVKEIKWFNIKHIIVTILVTIGLGYIFESFYLPYALIKMLIGCILVLYAMIIGRHITNLLIFSYVNRNPGHISGEVNMTHEFVLYLSLFQTVMVLVPIILIAIFSNSYFSYGGAIGITLFILVNYQWIRKANRQ